MQVLEGLNYNTQLPKLTIAEYGRGIQRMVDHCCTIEDREERNKCAKAIINVMGQLNPHLRDVQDFTHKLWDHLFVISKFKLDVDSPYPVPSQESLATLPERVNYPSGNIKYRHYGKTIENIIAKAKEYPEGAEKNELKRIIANQLKKSYITWNKDLTSDDIIIKHLDELSQGQLNLEDVSVISSSNELVKRNNNPLGNTGGGEKRHNNNKKHKHKFRKPKY